MNDITVAVIAPTAPCSAEVCSMLAPEVDKTVKVLILCGDVVLCVKRLVVGLNLFKVLFLIEKVLFLEGNGILLLLTDTEDKGDILLLSNLKLHIKLE